MDRLSRALRHVVAGFMVVALGALGGQLVFSSPATAQAGCGLEQCWNDGTCRSSYMNWWCDIDPETNSCMTMECDPHEGCGPAGCIE